MLTTLRGQANQIKVAVAKQAFTGPLELKPNDHFIEDD